MLPGFDRQAPPLSSSSMKFYKHYQIDTCMSFLMAPMKNLATSAHDLQRNVTQREAVHPFLADRATALRGRKQCSGPALDNN